MVSFSYVVLVVSLLTNLFLYIVWNNAEKARDKCMNDHYKFQIKMIKRLGETHELD